MEKYLINIQKLPYNTHQIGVGFHKESKGILQSLAIISEHHNSLIKLLFEKGILIDEELEIKQNE